MNEILARLASATLLLAVSALLVQGLSLVLRPSSPRVRQIAWFLVLVQGIVLFHLPVRLPWYEAAAEPGDASLVGPALPAGACPPRSSPTDGRHSRPYASELVVFTGPADRGSIEGIVKVAEVAPGPESKPFDWPSLAAAVWLGGMAVIVVFSGLSYVLFLRRLSHALPIEPAWADEWQRLLHQRGVSRPIGLVVTPSTGPALCWTPRGYRVCLPRRFWAELSHGERRSVLRHELAHFERSDLWRLLLARLLALPHWFNPLAWWAVRHVAESTEWTCDQAATGGKREDAVQLAKALLRLGVVKSLGLCRARPSRGSSLFIRIRRLTQFKSSEDSLMKKSLLLALATGLVAVNLVRVELVAKEPGRATTAADTVADKAAADNDSAPAIARETIPVPVRIPDAHAIPQPYGAPVPTTAGAASPRAVDPGPKTARPYAVADVLRQIREDQGLNERESKEFLKGWLADPVGGLHAYSLPNGQPAAERRYPSDMVWTGDNLLIETTAAGHKRIAEALKAIRQYGVAEITIEVLFLTGTAEELRKVGTNWTVMPLDLPATGTPENGSVLPASFDRVLAGGDAARPNRAQVVIERTEPVMFQILNEGAAKTVLEGFQSNPRANVLQAPKVTLFNGQFATVADASQSPFVVGFKDGKPQMRVVSEGVFLQLRPLLDRQGKVKLEVSLRSSKIREVKTLTVAGPSGKGVTVQVPEVETACVDTAVELASNHWLLVRCMEQQGPDGKPDSTVETGWKKRLLPSGLQRKGADRKPVSTLVMLWAGKPQDSHSGPFPWRRDK